MEADLRIARDIQKATLPTSLPSVPGYSIAAWLAPAEETAGDAYDVVTDEAGKLWFLVADAAGHGVGPALAVSQIQAMFRMGIRSGLGFMETLRHLNTAVCERLPVGVFVSAFMGELDVARHELRYAAAGCSPVLVVRTDAGGIESLTSTLPPLGVDEDLEESAIERLTLGSGDGLVVATDGVFEQPSPQGKRLGPSAYYASLLKAPGLTRCDAAKRLLDAVAERARQHRETAVQADDQTIVAIARDRSE